MNDLLITVLSVAVTLLSLIVFVGYKILKWAVKSDRFVKTFKQFVFGTIEEYLGGIKKDRKSRSDHFGNYKSYYTEYGRKKYGPKVRSYTDQQQQKRDVDGIIFDNRGEAETVLSNMVDLMIDYGLVTIADFYDLVGIKTSFSNNDWGWIGASLANVNVSRVRHGYKINLPDPIKLYSVPRRSSHNVDLSHEEPEVEDGDAETTKATDDKKDVREYPFCRKYNRVCGLPYALADCSLCDSVDNRSENDEEESIPIYPNGHIPLDQKHKVEEATDVEVEEIVFETIDEAQQIRNKLINLLDGYGFVTISDFYDCVGVSSISYNTNRFGWTDLRDAYIRTEKHGFTIKFPPAKLID